MVVLYLTSFWSILVMTPIRHFCDFLICIYHIFAGFVQWPELVWLFLVSCFFFARLLGVFLRYVGDTPVRLIKKVLQASNSTPDWFNCRCGPFSRWKHFLMTENTTLIDESCWINLGLTLGMIRPDIYLEWCLVHRNHEITRKTKHIWFGDILGVTTYKLDQIGPVGPNWSNH